MRLLSNSDDLAAGFRPERCQRSPTRLVTCGEDLLASLGVQRSPTRLVTWGEDLLASLGDHSRSS